MPNSLLYSIMLSKKETKTNKLCFIRSYLESNIGLLNFASAYDLFKRLQSNNDLNANTITSLCENLPSSYNDFIPFIIYLMHLEDDLNNQDNDINNRQNNIKHDHDY
jgi:hypothetical protein